MLSQQDSTTFHVKQNESLYLFHSTVIDSCDQPAFLCRSFWSKCSLGLIFLPGCYHPWLLFRLRAIVTTSTRLQLCGSSFWTIVIFPFSTSRGFFLTKLYVIKGHLISFYHILIRVISSSKHVLKDTISSEKEKKEQKKDLIVWSSFLWWVTMKFSRGIVKIVCA